MLRPPALAAYLALARLRPAPPDGGAQAQTGAQERPQERPRGRPAGPLVWMHAQDPARLGVLAALARHLAEEDGIATLLTVPPGTELPGPSESPGSAPGAAPGTSPGANLGNALLRHAPIESLAAIRAFLARWEPDLLLWTGDLRPALLAEARMPRLLLGAPGPNLLLRGGRVPGLARATLPLLDRAMVEDEEAAARLRRAGLPEGRATVGPALGEPPPVLPCNERERRDLAATLGSRPVWLAADLPMAELPEVIAAQRAASRSAHRLLVIVAPRDGACGPAMAREMAEAGLRVAARADGDEPEEAAQAYLAEGTGEMGLWLRLAPLSYLGGTLEGLGGRNPFEAAALGSAILHGPRTAPWEAHWRRLAAAGAARLVRTGAELGGAVESLLAPDRVAAMAHGAWDVATQGAEALARAAGVIREALDARDLARRAGR